jgi:hypothetical protein
MNSALWEVASHAKTVSATAASLILEEDNSAQYQFFESPTMVAVSQVTDMLKGVSSPDSLWFDEQLPELDVRVFQTLKRFVLLLHRTASTLKVAEERREVQLDVSAVLRAYDRISQTSVDERDEEITGELLGIVPIQRRFDFKRQDNNEILSGSVALSLSADYLERIERDELIAGRSWRALIRTKTVQRADGRQPSVSWMLIDLFPTKDIKENS